MSETAYPAKRPANYTPLSPVSFLRRSARVFPTKTAVSYGQRRYDYRTLLERSERLARAIRQAGVGADEVAAVMAHNTPELLEAHYGAPMAGAVLCAINTRLDAASVAFILAHSEARLLLYDAEFAPVVTDAARRLGRPIALVRIDDAQAGFGEGGEGLDYEAFLAGARPETPLDEIAEEWSPITLNYTSGTTGDPKGVLLHHRGAYLNACANVIAFGLSQDSVYLWTLPMFHCNGWTYTWAVTLAGGTHVCLRGMDPAKVVAALAQERVTHLCGAPIVLGMLIAEGEAQGVRFDPPVKIATGGAAPPSAVIAAMERLGFRVTHLYGMTESYGPAALCVEQPGVAGLPLEEKAAFMSRQGVNHPLAEDLSVISQETGARVPADGETLGELVIRGNTVMMGYLKNPAATDAALADGWLHTGDLAVLHPDSYVEIKDRAKDIIISGGENISSLEVEEVVFQHPAVAEAAVVARPDPKWGETPHLFVRLKPAAAPATADELIAWCRERLPHFKCPRYVTFAELPKTATGKIRKNELRDLAAAEAKAAER